jgi:hypothetical protein
MTARDIKVAVGVVLVAVVLGAAPPVSDSGPPRPTNDAGARGKQTGAVRSESAQFVTGDPEQINAVVAGSPPTAIVAVTPVPAKVGTYPPGTTIVGNTLTAPAGNFRSFYDVTVKNWDPNGDGSPGMHIVQVMVNAVGYQGSNAVPPNAGVNLAPPVVACPNNAFCQTLFGETAAKCELGFCKAGYVDKTGTTRLADNFCAPDSCSQGDVDTGSLSYRWFDIHSLPNRLDGHIKYWVGSLVLDIPAGAKGKYTVNLDTNSTFLDDGTYDIPTAERNGFVVNIATGSCCSDLNGAKICDPLSDDYVLKAECVNPDGSCAGGRTPPCMWTEDKLCMEGCLGQKPGVIVAWGGDAYGQQDVPTANAGFRAVSAGLYHSLGLGCIPSWVARLN